MMTSSVYVITVRRLVLMFISKYLHIPGIPSAFSFHRAKFGPQSLDALHTVWGNGCYNVCMLCRKDM